MRDIRSIFLDIARRVKRRNRLRNGDMFRIILSHASWRNPWSTGRFTYAADFDLNLLEAASRFIEYKEVPEEIEEI